MVIEGVAVSMLASSSTVEERGGVASGRGFVVLKLGDWFALSSGEARMV